LLLASHRRISELVVDSVNDFLAIYKEGTVLNHVNILQDPLGHSQVQPLIVSYEYLPAFGAVDSAKYCLALY
jgi:hypothetical protein